NLALCFLMDKHHLRKAGLSTLILLIGDLHNYGRYFFKLIALVVRNIGLDIKYLNGIPTTCPFQRRFGPCIQFIAIYTYRWLSGNLKFKATYRKVKIKIKIFQQGPYRRDFQVLFAHVGTSGFSPDRSGRSWDILDPKFGGSPDRLTIGQFSGSGNRYGSSGTRIHSILATTLFGKSSRGSTYVIIGNPGDRYGDRVGNPPIDHVHLIGGNNCRIRFGDRGKGCGYGYRDRLPILHKH